MAETQLSSQIYLSRESIRRQISEEVKTYLELENVDLTKSSFLTFLIDIVSTLTGNLLFYQLSTYREFFLTKAQLPESILNLAAFLGYNTVEAIASVVNVLITVPFGFDDPSAVFTIPEGFTFSADNEIDFKTYYTTTITVTNNANVTVLYQEANRRFNLPVDIATDGESFSFALPLRQQGSTIQEFQIDSDTREYQFVILDVPVDGQVSSIVVEIREPGNPGYTIWDEFQSLYLMSTTDKGFVSRRTDTGRRLTFGNDLIGVQPAPGSTVRVTSYITKGSEGNVIAGSIRTGERIYLTTFAGVRQVVNYEVINTTPAFGGEDEESLEEVRSNSIKSITTLERLVTENDYKNINLVIPPLPLAQNSLPVLKRSDLQVNEIELFSGILYGASTEEVDNLVPMRNIYVNVPAGTLSIPRGTIISLGDYEYYTIFDLTIEELNSVAYYKYIIYEISLIPALETSYASTYDIYADSLIIYKSGVDGKFKLQYKSTEVDASLCTCEMIIESSGSIKNMTNINDGTSSYFIYSFSPYTDIPSDEQIAEFTIYNPSGDPVSKYRNNFTFTRTLDTFMRSNVLGDGTSLIVYDIPVIEKEYYDGIDKRQFELIILQSIVTQMDLSDRRMLTDFTNIKFTNTHGILENIKYNPATRSDVIDIINTLPVSPSVGDRYIYTAQGDNQDAIIRCIDATNVSFYYEQPSIDTIVYVTNLAEKYIYSERGWITIPNYTIPLDIEVEVFREPTFSGTLSDMVTTVRSTLYSAFKSRFGTNSELYRSEIIDVIHNIDGVSHCRVRKPETSIFFKFELKTLTQEQLLRYGPEYVFFTEDNITVKVI